MAVHAVDYVRALGWRVSDEVLTDEGPVVDIIAERGPKVWALPCKLSFGVRVMVQGYRLLRRAHLVSPVVPEPTSNHADADVLADIVERCDMGLLLVSPDGSVREVRQPRALTPKRSVKIQTHPQQRSGRFAQAGAAGGGHYTPRNEFREMLRDFIDANPRCSIQDLVRDADHGIDDDKRARFRIQDVLKDDSTVTQFGAGTNARYLREDVA